MALWLDRAGRHGEHEEAFFGSGRIYLTWREIFADRDPTQLRTEDEIWALVDELYPENSKQKRANTAAQFAAFLLRMKAGDWVVTPRKEKGTIAIVEVMGPARSRQSM
jgi:predicted Mrr-cat superfamily restriction endonuclease